MKSERYKQRLEEELAILTKELLRVGRINPNNPADWEPVPEDRGSDDIADQNVVADHKEAFEENSAIVKELEIRFNNVKRALNKISDGTFGVCEIGGKSIEKDRLDANPAARTCKEHLGELEE